MFKTILDFTILGITFLVASGLCKADEESLLTKNFTMGGSAIGLRGASKQDAEATFNVYLADLYKQNNLSSTLTIVMYPNSELMLAAFDKGIIDGFFGTPLEYLSRKEQICKQMAGIEYKHGALKQRFLVVVRADEGIRQLKELQNKRITLSPYMDIETLYLNTYLLKNQLPEISSFFQTRQDAKSPNMALMDVFFNKSDVTVVRENEYNIAVELNPQLGKKLMVLSRSEPYLATVGVISNKVSEADFRAFVKSFNDIMNGEKGKKLMDIVMVSKVTIVTSEDVDSLQDLVTEYASLSQSVKHSQSVKLTPPIKPADKIDIKYIQPKNLKNKRNVQ